MPGSQCIRNPPRCGKVTAPCVVAVLEMFSKFPFLYTEEISVNYNLYFLVV